MGRGVDAGSVLLDGKSTACTKEGETREREASMLRGERRYGGA